MIKVMLIGGGRMGQTVMECISRSHDFSLVQCVKTGDSPALDSNVLIDFSSPEAFKKIYPYCAENYIPAVIATTGYDDEQFGGIIRLSKKVPVFYAQNMSVGMAATYTAIKRLALILKDCDIDIIEKHHRGKKDSPSGTAFMLAKAMADDKGLSINTSPQKRNENEINVSSIRAGSLVGEHEVLFNMDGEYISIKHVALSRQIFATGALNAARFILDKPPGLYTINDLFIR